MNLNNKNDHVWGIGQMMGKRWSTVCGTDPTLTRRLTVEPVLREKMVVLRTVIIKYGQLWNTSWATARGMGGHLPCRLFRKGAPTIKVIVSDSDTIWWQGVICLETINPYNVEIVLEKVCRSKVILQMKIIIDVLVSSSSFIWIPMIWVYGQYK